MKHGIVAALAAGLVWTGAAMAADARGKPADSVRWSPSAAEGEVRRVDREGGKLTIRHGPIPNLDMPPMTMVFQVADAAMLDRVKPGDKVTFEADKVGNVYRVTRIVAAPAPR
jgi:Cu/Ag efflux protein CusF